MGGDFFQQLKGDNLKKKKIAFFFQQILQVTAGIFSTELAAASDDAWIIYHFHAYFPFMKGKKKNNLTCQKSLLPFF